MDLGIAGKRALVLGASKGLGAASARALLGEGVEVHTISRSGTSPAPGMTALAADLSHGDGVKRVIDHVANVGRFDILVANSGGPRPGPVQGVGNDEWQANFVAMAVPFFRISDAVLPGMLVGNWGRIITIGSTSVVQPIPGIGISNTVRGAVAGWSKTLANEVASYGITVNMVLPGRFDTDRVCELDGLRAKAEGLSTDQVKAAVTRDIPVGRYGNANEFGAVVAFVASQQAAYITGSMLRIDGGGIRSI